MSTDPDEIPETLPEMESRRHQALHAVVSFAAIVGILITVIVVIMILATTRPVAEKEETRRLVPPVHVMVVETRNQPVTLSAQGVVESQREVMIAAEVSGSVEFVSPNLLRGSSVAENEVLVRIEDADYRAAEALAKTQVAEAKLNIELEYARRDQAIRDWDKLGKGAPPKLALRKPQLASAEARLESAGAELERAVRNIERSVIRAPFAARVRQKSVEIGGFLTPGGVVAELYSPTRLEVRLPLSLEDFGFLKRLDDGSIGGEVTLRGTVGVTEYTWAGTIARADGEIDRKTLSATVIVEVEPNTDAKQPSHLRYPPVGLFVRATVPGRDLQGVAELPRLALRDSNLVIVVEDGNIARERSVTVLRRGRDRVWISEGLDAGDQVILKGMRGVTKEGVEVQITDAPEAPATKPQPEVPLD